MNDFLFNVLGEQPKNDTKMILAEYFRLDDQNEEETNDTNQMAVIEAEH